MSAASAASDFCNSLRDRKIRYTVDFIRDETVLVSLAVPGERWEFEYFEDGSVELERFASMGVNSAVDPLALVVAQYDQ